jgi:hypothetical protein
MSAADFMPLTEQRSPLYKRLEIEHATLPPGDWNATDSNRVDFLDLPQTDAS